MEEQTEKKARLKLRTHADRDQAYTDWAKFPLENPHPVLRTDPEGTILIANRACSVLLREWGSKVGSPLPERIARLVHAAFVSRKKRSIDLACRDRLYSFFIVPIVQAGYVNLYGVDDTERKQAEAALTRSHAELETRVNEHTRKLRETLAELQGERQRLHDVLDMLPAYIILLTPDHHVAFANRFFEQRFGEDHGRKCHEYLFKRSEPCEHCESFIPLRTGSRHGWEWRGPDGHYYEITDFPFPDRDGATLIMEMGIDVTDRKLAEAELGERKVRLEELVASRTEQLEGLNAELQSEISNRRQTEEELLRVNRTLQALSNSSLAMVKASTEADYMAEVCRIIVEDCGHTMVWIGMAEMDEAKSVRPVAHAGQDSGYLAAANITWEESERGRGPTGTAIRTGEICVRGDLLGDPDFRFMAGEAAKRGYAAAIALPLRSNGQIFGAITIYSNQQNPFAEAEIKLLSELAADLAFGIASIRWRTALAESVQSLTQTSTYLQSLFDHANAPIIVWDPDFRITQFNRAFEQMTGHAARDVIGKPLALLFPADSRDSSIALIELSRGGEYWQSVEIPILCQDGTIRIALWNSANIYAPDGYTLVAVIAQGQDITERTEMQKALQASRDELELRVKERTAELEQINQTLEGEIAERKVMQQQLHSLSTMLAKTEERERRRIATDLHDRIIQNLVFANIQLGSLREARPDAGLVTAVDGIYQNIQQTIHDLRTLTFELSPPVLYELGFLPAVKWLIRQFEEKYDLTIEFEEYDLPEFINEELRLILFQALRELLTNAVKHARAASIKVAVGRHFESLYIHVEDDGIGFDSRLNTMNRKDNTGFGLFNIRQRLESVGGCMTIQSGHHAGTRIEMIAPLYY